jgi:hypothetical protein
MGREVSIETRQKISEKAKSYKHMLGKKHSEETKRKMSESAKKRKSSSADVHKDQINNHHW